MLAIGPLTASADALEIVERRGLGQADALCDGIAEAAIIALGRHYRDVCGEVPRHGIDRVLLWGGEARPALGGGTIIAPFEILIAASAPERVRGAVVPVRALVEDAARTWLRQRLHDVDVDTGVRVGAHVHAPETVVAARTPALGFGWAPLSLLETAVLAVERRLTEPATTRGDPALGEDVTITAVRQGHCVAATLTCALVGRHLSDRAAYDAATRRVAELAFKEFARHLDRSVDVVVNPGDGEDGRSGLTVSGVFAENGRGGGSGHGNQANGLITPLRPTAPGACAGRSPVRDATRLANLAAGLIAAAVHRDVPGVQVAQCSIVHGPDQPWSRPGLVDVRVATQEPGAERGLRPAIEEVVERTLAWLPNLWRDTLDGVGQLDRWPYAGPARPRFHERADDARRRAKMVQTITADLEGLRGRLGRAGLGARTSAALGRVPRQFFVAKGDEYAAYDNNPLPIGFGQTISQPTIVALMTDLLRLRENHRVLEIGTGSGYQAAVLAELVRQVYSIETVEPLAEAAARRLAHLGYVNVDVHAGDGAQGWAEHAPYDGIIVTAAGPDVPVRLLDQLRPGGRLVAPVGHASAQELIVIDKAPDGTLRRHVILPVSFVPLVRDGGGPLRSAGR